MRDEGYVYVIENQITKKVYVGISSSYQTRWYQHKLFLNKNSHHSIRLQRAWNKYGEENFIFRLIDQCPLDDLYRREIKYILQYNSYVNGYNMTKGGEGGDWRVVLQYDRVGQLIKRYNSITFASDENKINHTYIWNACNNKQQTAGNFQWCYEGDEDRIKTKCRSQSKVQKVYQYSDKGILIAEHSNAMEAAKVLSIKTVKSYKSVAINIRKACRNKYAFAHDYYWRFTESDRIEIISKEQKKENQLSEIRNRDKYKRKGASIIQYSLKNRFIEEYAEIDEVRKVWGPKWHAIAQCLQGRQKTSHGFIWKYKTRRLYIKREIIVMTKERKN